MVFNCETGCFDDNSVVCRWVQGTTATASKKCLQMKEMRVHLYVLLPWLAWLVEDGAACLRTAVQTSPILPVQKYESLRLHCTRIGNAQLSIQ